MGYGIDWFRRFTHYEKDMNNKGKGSGLALIIILVVAIIVAYLAVSNMSSLGFGKKQETQQEQIQDPVQQAQDIVDQINQRQHVFCKPFFQKSAKPFCR